MRIYQTESRKIQYLEKYKKNPLQEQNISKNADKVLISNKALNIKDIQKELAQIPEIREDRVKELKEQVQKGTYRVPARAIASKILNYGLE
ncbi:MAG: flagellar biosynthesis anti-sigma factor FlgM [Halanaerobiales bacterium]